MRLGFLVAAACVLGVTAAQGQLVTTSVVCTERLRSQEGGRPAPKYPVSGIDTIPECVVHPGEVPGATAVVKFANNMNTTGWGDLRSYVPIGAGSPSLTSYAAGFLEGYVTSQMICDFSYDLQVAQWNGNETQRTLAVQFLRTNMAWAVSNANSNGSVYWAQVGNVFAKSQGIADGHSASAERDCTITVDDILIINAQGDLGDIQSVVDVSSRPDWDAMTFEEVVSTSLKRSHCTVTVRFQPDMSELYAAHTTWSSYNCMIRVFKLYVFEDPLQPGKNFTMQLSSYPGSISSTDDFFQMSTGLVVMETTNDVFNETLFDIVVPQNLLSWTRAVVCNVVARTGPAWGNTFGWYNSGTYSNMWIVVDYNKFTKGQPLQANALTIAEQLPGIVAVNDVTQVLSYGCFPSYNRPYDRHIFQLSGFDQMVQKYGVYFTYHGNPRATIFRRDAFKVQSIDDLKAFMRYNDWQNDPLSLGNAANQIAARYDLINSTLPGQMTASAGGSIDAKLTSASLLAEGAVWAAAGPTYTQQPAFTWDSQWSAVNPHRGQPEVFKFDYTMFSL